MSPVQRAAALVVCDRATDAAEARELLLMLGLVGEDDVVASEKADDVAAWWQELVEAGYARPVTA